MLDEGLDSSHWKRHLIFEGMTFGIFPHPTEQYFRWPLMWEFSRTLSTSVPIGRPPKPVGCHINFLPMKNPPLQFDAVFRPNTLTTCSSSTFFRAPRNGHTGVHLLYYSMCGLAEFCPLTTSAGGHLTRLPAVAFERTTLTCYSSEICT